MYRKVVISFCLSVVLGAAVSATPRVPVSDTLDVFDEAALYADVPLKDTAKVWDRGFDVRNYLNSTRYRVPGHTIFNNKNFFSNTFVGVRGSVLKVIGEEYGYGPTVGGVLGKWVTPSVGVRLGAGIGYWKDNFDARKIRELDLSADVMFNLISHLYGYDTARFFEISMVAGVGFTHVWKTMAADETVRPSGNGLSGRLGLNFDMKVFDRLHLYFEPRIDMYLNPLKATWGNGISLSEATPWNAYTRAFNTTVGLTYNFGQTKPEVERLSGSWRDPEAEWNGYFVSVLGGSQFLFNSANSWASDLAAAERFGTQFSVGGGRWFNDYFALRLSAAYTKNSWLKFLSDRPWTSRYISMRLEGMVDVLNLGRRIYNNSKGLATSSDPMFGLSIIAGPEMGQIVKSTQSEIYRDYYVGIGTGLQARLRVLKWLSLLAEPRFTFIPYSTANTTESISNLRKNYHDGLMSFNLGVEARIPSYNYLLKAFRSEHQFEDYDFKNFFSNTFVGVRAMTTKLRGGNFGYGPAAGGVIGKWVHPAVGIRLGAGLGYWYDNVDSRRVRDINLTADVMVNLMSAIGGYNPFRFADVSIVAGAGVDQVWKSVLPTETARLKGNALSGHIGLNLDMKIFDHLSLFIEPQAVLYLNPTSSNKGITLSGDGKRYTLGSNTSVGLAYNFGQITPDGERMSCSWKDEESESKGYFLTLMGGAQTIFNSGNVWKGMMTARERFGAHVSVGGGRWFSDLFALRLSASYSRNNSNKFASDYLLTTRYVNMRLEGMLDLMKLGGRLNHNSKAGSEDSFFGLALLAGPEAGFIRQQGITNNFSDIYVGLTGGLQARFRVHKWITLLAEPRASLVPYSISMSGNGGPRANRIDGLMSFNAGLEVRLPNLYPILYQEMGLYDFARGNFFNNTFIGARGSIVKLRGESAGIGHTAGAFVGKWVHPVLAVRLGGGMGYWYDNYDARRVRELELSADLLVNVTTALGGYNPARFFEASLVGGVGMTHVWKSVLENETARKRGDALSGRFGLNFDMKVFDRMHLFVEPMVSMYLNPFKSNKSVNLYGSRYTFGASGSVGLTYNFRQTQPEGERLSASYRNLDSDWNGYFVSALGGTQLQLYPRTVYLSAKERPGMHISVGGGRWFNDYFGLRLSASYSRNNWIKYGTDKPKNTRYIAARLEGMFDIFNVCRRIYGTKYDDSYGSVPVFGLSLLAGPEMGHMLKQEYKGVFSDHYVAAVGGLQARVRVHKLVSILAEPRVTLIPYTIYTGVARSGNRIDGLVSLNAGLEVRIPTYRNLNFSDEVRKEKAKKFAPTNFFDNTFAGVRASSTTLFGSGFGAGQGFGAFVGKRVHPIVGIRLGAGFGYWFDNSDARRVREFDMTADAMFDMISAVSGYNPSRFCDVSLVVGGGINHVWKSLTEFDSVRKRGDALSGRLGVNVDMKVFDRIRLFIEPQAVLYLTPYSSNRGIRLTGSRYGIGANTSVGLTYNFGQSATAYEGMAASWKTPQSDWDGYFVSFLGGVQFQAKGAQNLTRKERVGMHYSVGGGRWLNDFFGLRVSGSYSRNSWIKYGQEKPLNARYTSLRLEGMLDVLNLGTRIYNNYKGRENVSDPLFGLSVLAGPEVGHVLKKSLNRANDIRSHYVGLTGGLQARVRVNEWVSVLAEPRMTILPYSVRTTVGRANRRDALMNLNLGLEVRIPKSFSLRNRTVDHSDFNKGDFFSNTFAGARAGSIQLAGTSYGPGQMAGVFVGKWVHPVVAIRLGTGLGYWYSNYDSRRVREFDLTADAMFNMRSAFGGYSPKRFCEVSVVAGVGLTHAWKAKLPEQKEKQKGDALSGRLGLNLDMKIFDEIHLFVEPQAALYLTPGSSNKGVSLTGGRYILGSNTTVGLTYNFGQTRPEGKRMSASWSDPKSDWNGYFASALGGVQFQCNGVSNMTGSERNGMYVSVGGGRWFNDFFALRVSGSVSSNNWKKYKTGDLMNSYYLSARLEGMLDVISVCRRIYSGTVSSLGSTDRFFGLSVLAGPELGYMKKRDLNRDDKGCYIGFAGGIQARFRVNKWISVLAEPRVTVVPHSAPNASKIHPAPRTNTIDGVMSFNAGIELRIPTSGRFSR